MSPSQVFFALRETRDGDPKGWQKGFIQQANLLTDQAKSLMAENEKLAAGQAFMGAAYAYRAAIQFTSIKSEDFLEWALKMEQAFQEGIKLMSVPVRPIEIPYADKSLAGYYLEHNDEPRPVVIMIGGGDTFREDLFYFAGFPGWKRGYNVMMVDLPGQGLMPFRGLPFQVDMAEPISAILDWLEKEEQCQTNEIAIYGVSGGGYFSAQAASVDPRIKAWIAATPIYDIGNVFKREMGATQQAPGWVVNAAAKFAGSVNESAAINLEKYAWQFGTKDFKSAIDMAVTQVHLVDYTRINCPSLFLISDGEGPELLRQSQVVAQNLMERGISVRVRRFTVEEGADGHCQLNNLRLAHLVIFDWLDKLFEHDPGEIRLRC
jgi:pimeloyl-ACP methyl ester carboxylesterase